MKKRVSLSDIAQETNVSKMTVSLALRNHPRISSSTRDRVLATANQMGYTPNPEVSRLMAAIRHDPRDGQGLPLAFLTGGPGEESWRDSPATIQYRNGADARARKYGYYLENCWINAPELSEAQLSDSLANRGILGLVFPPSGIAVPPEPREREMSFDWAKFAAVAIGARLASLTLYRVIPDHYRSVLQTMDALRTLGYQRIGLCLKEPIDPAVEQRWQAGYLVYCANHPLEPIEPLIHPEITAPDLGQWIEGNRLDAVIGSDHRIPAILRKLGKQPGKGIAYADLDLDRENPALAGISGIAQNFALIGAAAVDLVFASIQRNELGIPEVPLILQIEGNWVPGASTPQKKKATKKPT